MTVGVIHLSDTGKVVSADSNIAMLLNRDPERLQGVHIDGVLLPPDERESSAFDLIRTRLGQSLKLSGITASCEKVELEVASLRTLKHYHQGYAIIISSISRQSELLQEKRRLMALFSHDVRAPLNSILAFLELLEIGTYGQLAPQALSSLSVAQKNARRVVAMAENLLKLEYISSGHACFEDTRVCLGNAVIRALESVQSQLMRKQIFLQPELLEEAFVIGDLESLVQVLVNLLDNAVKYSRQGSSIRVCLERIGDQYEVRICDNGPGIKQELQAQIFEPFFKGARNGEQKGFGLGLSLCKSVVERHGGSIGVVSGEGAGSVFWFRLAAADEIADFSPPRGESAVIKSDSSALVVN